MRHRLTTLAAACLLLAGCAGLSPDGRRGDALQLAQAQGGLPTPQAQASLQDLLARQPLSADDAVRIALINNPALDAAMATLAISDAERVQAARLPNPQFAISRLREGQSLEIERMLSFNVLQLATLPWRARDASEAGELATLQAAQQVLRLAADTRRAWLRAVAAQQAAGYLETAQDAAAAGAELARRMARVGNISRLQQAREQDTLAGFSARLAQGRQLAFSERERLTRLLGLAGSQAGYDLPDRLPELPATLQPQGDIEARALRERLDVRAATEGARQLAGRLGLARATGVVDVLELGIARNTTFDNAAGTRSSARGLELTLPLPVFDWGQAGHARAQASYLRELAAVREVALRARSEARDAWHGWRTAWDLARHHRDEVLPLRKFITGETLLRTNGMLASPWELLAEARHQADAVHGAINAQRDFWIADTDLQAALSGAPAAGTHRDN